MRDLLDNEALTGTYDVTTMLRAQRAVRAAACADAETVVHVSSYLCQVWGGGTHPVLHTRAAANLGVAAGVMSVVTAGAGLAEHRPGAWCEALT